jgi:hypothetical protein
MKIATLTLAAISFGAIGLASTPAAATEIIEMPASGACPAGYSRTNVNSVSARNVVRNYKCQRDGATYQAASTGSFNKPNPLDRCPIGWFTNPENGRECKTEAANPPTIRLKGSAPCRTGEVDDWGVYCVSNYANLEAGERAKGTSDFNAICLQSYYITGSQQSPRQANLPQGVEYTPAYFTIYGNVTPDGAPIGGGAAPAPAASNATRAAATQSAQSEPAQSQPAPTNCPAPSGGNAGAGAQIGSQLGGLLGGRRGNSQAGAVLGGLLGAVAGSRAAAKPAGCP